MGHYAKIEHGIVVHVSVIDEDYFEKNKETRYKDQWVKCSYNTVNGVHINPETKKPSEDQSKALRKNFPSIGYIYDEERDAFIPPKPYSKFILDEEKCNWMPPIPVPDESKSWDWNDNKGEWEELIV
jgi:hypothetical protein